MGYELEKAEVGGQEKRLPVAKKLGGTSLMFLVHPTLRQENMHYVVEQVKEVMSHAKALRYKNNIKEDYD